MDFPTNLKYSEEHEWVKANDDGTAIIGITHFAAEQLGDIVYLDVEVTDDEIGAGDDFGSIEAVKTVSDLYMPISGTVLEVNPKAHESGDDEPEIINSDPYGEGWIIKIQMSDSSELDNLMDAAAYEAMVSE